MTGAVHYAMTFEEVRAVRFIDRGDHAACPPKACGHGDFHAAHSSNWRAVTCPACLAKAPASAIVASITDSQGEILTMGDGSRWLHPHNGAAPVRLAEKDTTQ